MNRRNPTKFCVAANRNKTANRPRGSFKVECQGYLLTCYQSSSRKGRIRKLLAPDLPEKYLMANQKQEIKSDPRTVSVGLIAKGFSQRSILETFDSNCFDYKYPVPVHALILRIGLLARELARKKGH